MSGTQDLEARKSLLTAQADLARVQLGLALHEARMIVMPPATGPRSTGSKRFAKFLVAAAMPVLGRTRFGRLLRYASFGLAAVRAISNWRSRG